MNGRPGMIRALGHRTGAAAMVLAVALMASAGCRTADPDARTTLGNVSARVPGTPVEVIAATERAMRRMDMTLVASNATDVDGRVTARSPRRRPVDVRVFEDVDDHSRVSIRIGAFGQQDASIGLLQRIRRELRRDPAEYADFEYKFEQDEEPEAPEEPAQAGEAGQQDASPQDADTDTDAEAENDGT